MVVQREQDGDGFCDYGEGDVRCGKEAIYCLEWHGLDQYGKNPEIVGERYCCTNPEHIVGVSRHPSFGGYPDEIHDVINYQIKRELLFLVKRAIDGELELKVIEEWIQKHDFKRWIRKFDEKKKQLGFPFRYAR